MVPFEPKTDSEEFETGPSDQSASAGSQNASSEAADLTIRIWRQDAGSDTAALTWDSESVLVYMIADLVAASHGRAAVETPAVMAARFDSSLQGLVAAKRIQTAVLEFLACRQSDYIGAAILIHPPLQKGFSQGKAQSALRLAEPGQIILSQEIASRFQNLPGFELRAVPALTTGGSEHAGLAELIWTSSERLARLRNTAGSAVPTANVETPFGATMIVNAPFTAPRSEGSNAAPRSTESSAGFNQANRGGAFEETLAEFEEQRSFLTPLRLAIGAIAIVLVVVGLVLFHPWSGSNVKPKAPVLETPTGASLPTAEPPPANAAQPPPASPPIEDSAAEPQPPVVKSPAPNKPPLTAKGKEKEKGKKSEDTAIRGFEGNSTYDGVTQRDISRLLQWAKSDAGNGNYPKAAQEYRAVLQLQPGNPEAREGLRRIQLAQGSNH
jgi:hypothetical protein